MKQKIPFLQGRYLKHNQYSILPYLQLNPYHLQDQQKRYICEEVVKGPVFLTDYPKEIKAFYMRLNDDNKKYSILPYLQLNPYHLQDQQKLFLAQSSKIH